MLELAKNFVQFHYDNKMAIMNADFPRPLIFTKGIEKLKDALDNPSLIKEGKLLDLLIKFKVLVKGQEIKPKTHQSFIFEGKKDLGLYMLVTQSCNLRCNYCLGDNPGYMNCQTMNLDTAKKALEKAAQSMLPNGKIQVIYFGGEPLLNWKLIKQCIEYIDNDLKNRFDVKFKNHVTTNLTLLPEDFIDLAIKHDISVLVDIDGDKNIHNKMRPEKTGKGSYDTIMKNLEKISKSSIYYELRATVTSDNVNHIRDISNHHSNLNPAACAFPTLIPVDSEGNPISSDLYPNPDTFSKGLKDVILDNKFDLSCVCPSNVISARMLRGEFVIYGCGMILGNTAVINYDGDVYPCIYFVGQKDFLLGNIKESNNPLSQKNWYDKFYSKHESKLHVDNLEECKDCSIRYLCGGGCSVRMLSLNRNDQTSLKARKYFLDINCKSSWASVEAAIKYFENKTKDGKPAYVATNPPGKGGW